MPACRCGSVVYPASAGSACLCSKPPPYFMVWADVPHPVCTYPSSRKVQSSTGTAGKRGAGSTGNSAVTTLLKGSRVLELKTATR